MAADGQAARRAAPKASRDGDEGPGDGIPLRGSGGDHAVGKAAGVQRGGKGLNAPIPTTGKANVSSLSGAVRTYAQHGNFHYALNKPDIKQSILAGHGGAMVEKLDQEVLMQQIHERQDGPSLGK